MTPDPAVIAASLPFIVCPETDQKCFVVSCVRIGRACREQAWTWDEDWPPLGRAVAAAIREA